jgi:hypothetical protein
MQIEWFSVVSCPNEQDDLWHLVRAKGGTFRRAAAPMGVTPRLRKRPKRLRARPTPLHISEILGWADGHFRRTGKWPHGQSGPVVGSLGESWRKIDSALRLGLRGLPGGSSLARLLAERRGKRYTPWLPRLTHKQILAWTDAHHRRTRRWPTSESGPIPSTAGETWRSVDHALRLGMRGLKGGWSLARLLAAKHRVKNIQDLPRLTIEQILAWADAYHARHGMWPLRHSGPVAGTWGETWGGVDAALHNGRRGFRGGSTLARLLAKRRGVRNPKDPPRLSVEQVLKWARAHRRRTGSWPTCESGAVLEAQGETWNMMDRALRYCRRGIRRKSSLFRLVGGASAK